MNRPEYVFKGFYELPWITQKTLLKLFLESSKSNPEKHQPLRVSLPACALQTLRFFKRWKSELIAIAVRAALLPNSSFFFIQG